MQKVAHPHGGFILGPQPFYFAVSLLNQISKKKVQRNPWPKPFTSPRNVVRSVIIR